MTRLRADGAAAMVLRPTPLEGHGLRLEPYAPPIKTEIAEALDCDSQGWSVVSSSGQGEQFESWWDSALKGMAAETTVAYAVRRLSDGRVLGVSSFINIRAEHCGVEIGATFLRPEARAGAVNPTAKLLMLERAFGAGALRVELLTDLRNSRSQAAIAKLGAVREGVLRRHKVTWTGHIRDTVLFSITDLDWPQVRERLTARVEAFGG